MQNKEVVKIRNTKLNKEQCEEAPNIDKSESKAKTIGVFYKLIFSAIAMLQSAIFAIIGIFIAEPKSRLQCWG